MFQELFDIEGSQTNFFLQKIRHMKACQNDKYNRTKTLGLVQIFAPHFDRIHPQYNV